MANKLIEELREVQYSLKRLEEVRSIINRQYSLAIENIEKEIELVYNRREKLTDKLVREEYGT